MGQGCTKCSVGNPCTDPTCNKYGSQHLQGLLDHVRNRWENLQESARAEDQNHKMAQELDRRFEEKSGISADGFKYYANNVRQYLNKPQPKIDELNNVEYRLMLCLDSHKQGEYMECSNFAQDLKDLATAGRDPPSHCKGKSDSYTCTFASTSTLEKGAASSAKAGVGTNQQKSYAFGSCYA